MHFAVMQLNKKIILSTVKSLFQKVQKSITVIWVHIEHKIIYKFTFSQNANVFRNAFLTIP